MALIRQFSSWVTSLIRRGAYMGKAGRRIAWKMYIC